MTHHAISVENLGKRYLRGGQQAAYRTFREDLLSRFCNPFLASTERRHAETFWALSGIGFHIDHGEIVGIVGRNGSGKSTLLKILSRITAPTTGRAVLRGRVGSLLEVGTGFHPELTGRENIFLSGTILGMRRSEIQRCFEEIVDFSELEDFLDTPVKHYSSGMYVRLGFAVAAHLTTEILLVDEVLAVGDAGFQKKCLGKMDSVAREGRTVLFVSHNMAAVQRLCTSSILLERGTMAFRGSVDQSIRRYLSSHQTGDLNWQRTTKPQGAAWIDSIKVLDADHPDSGLLTTASHLRTEIVFSLRKRTPRLQLSVDFLGPSEDVILVTIPQDGGLHSPCETGTYLAVIDFPPELLLERVYGLRANLYVPDLKNIDRVDSIRFSVEPAASLATLCPSERAGAVVVRCVWGISQKSPDPQSTLESSAQFNSQ
jgi:lipopolysaccharide transport system ATP-binding protein